MKIISRKAAVDCGLKLYFTGEACKNGHIAERRTGNCGCLICERDRLSELYLKNKDCFLERSAKWRADHLERHKELTLIWRSKNKEIANERSAKWHQENKDRSQKIALEWRSRNKDKISNNTIKWRIENPEKYRANCGNRRARKINAEGSHTYRDIEKLLQMQRYKCAACQVDVRKTGHHIDHIMPLSKGGGNGPCNLQILCPTCNMKKSAKHPIEWANERGLLL